MTDRQPVKRHSAATVLLVIALLFVLILIFSSRSEQTATTARATSGNTSPGARRIQEPARAKTGSRRIRATYWCGVSFDDAGRVGVAVAEGDTAAVAGLLARGKAFQVERGTRVVTGGEIEMGISLVQVESGFHAGRKCYISTNALE